MRERGVDKKVTVQKVCKVCKDEKDVRAVLDKIWEKPKKAKEIISETLSRNLEVFEFEETLAK